MYVFRKTVLIPAEKCPLFGCDFLFIRGSSEQVVYPHGPVCLTHTAQPFKLISDPVPNVRVLLAKVLRQILLEKGTGASFLSLQILSFIRQQLVFLFQELWQMV